MKIIYVAAPLGSGPDRERNRQNAARWCSWIAAQGHAPIASWIVIAGKVETDDGRKRGLEIDLALVARADELWLVGGRVSPGMTLEMHEARRLGIPVVDLTHLGWDVPVNPIRYNACTDRCDMRDGPCACGAWHKDGK